MTVTKITEISKSRVQIMTDEEFAFVLYKGELRIYGLKEGEEISPENFKSIVEELLPKRAKMRAMNLLKARPYTTKQLQDKLLSGGYPRQIVDIAVSYVSSFGYLDDEKYAADYIEYHKENQTRTKIFNALLQKGIDKSVIETCWDELVAETSKYLEQQQIIYWIQKKKFNAADATFEEKQKFCAFLYRKGFQIDTIRRVLSLDITSI